MKKSHQSREKRETFACFLIRIRTNCNYQSDMIFDRIRLINEIWVIKDSIKTKKNYDNHSVKTFHHDIKYL